MIDHGRQTTDVVSSPLALIVHRLSSIVGERSEPHPPIPDRMLLRTVRMTFRPDALEAFLEIFDAAAPQIRAVPGCRYLELWQDERFPNIVTTYSHWTNADALHRYRHSDLFRSTWATTKPLFAAPPVAHSQHVLRAEEKIEGSG